MLLDMIICKLFLLTYFLTKHAVRSQCSGVPKVIQLTLFTPSYIESPNLGSSVGYGQNLNCSWLFERASNSTHVLYDVRSFKLGGTDRDHLKVFRGSDNQGTSIFNPVITGNSSLSNNATDNIFVTFVTDENPDNNGIGFIMYIIEGEESLSSSARCETAGQNLTATVEENYITSPSFPSAYPLNTNCTWTIMVDDYSDIIISLYYVDIEPESPTKCYDSLELTGMEIICKERIWYIDGYNLTFDDDLTITFTSDSQVHKKGFVLSYRKFNETALLQTVETTSVEFTVSSSLTDTTYHSETIDTNLSQELTTEPSSKVASDISTSMNISSEKASDIDLTSTFKFSTIGISTKSDITPSSAPSKDQAIVSTTSHQKTTSTPLLFSNTEQKVFEQTKTTAIATSLQTNEHVTLSDEENSDFISPSVESTTTGTNKTTISPAALGGIITIAVIGVAGVGILFGVIIVMLINFKLRRKLSKSIDKKEVRRSFDQTERPSWIRMIDTLQMNSFNTNNIEDG